MDENCRIWVGTRGHAVIIAIEGRATHAQASTLRQYLSEAMGCGHDSIKVDLSHCVSLDSTVIGVLGSAAKHLRDLEAGGAVFFNAHHNTVAMLEELGVDRLIQFVDTLGPTALSDAALPENRVLLSEHSATSVEWAKTVLEAHEYLTHVRDAPMSY
jgi:anti-anti-sigma regulatory factor